MPRLPATPQVLRCRIVGTNQGSVWNNVLHWQYTGAAPDATICAAIGNAMLNAWGGAFKHLMSPGVVAETCEVTDLTSDTSAQGEGTSAQVGTSINAQDQPTSAATVISLHINRHYRGGHPRMYIPFCHSIDLTNGRDFTQEYLDDIRPSAATFLSTANGITAGTTTGKLVAVSYYDQKVLRPAGVPFPIQSTSVKTRLDSQRRRLGKETA